MRTERHKIMDGRVQLFHRPKSPFWWASCTINGEQERESTNQVSLALAKDAARDWYLGLLGKLVSSDLAAPTRAAANDLRDVDRYLSGEFHKVGKMARKGKRRGVTFKDASEKFLAEYEVITEGERNADYVAQQGMNLRVHLLPFLGDKLVTEITPGTVQEYRMHRMTSRKDKDGKPKRPARSTIHHEIITLRHVLKTANRHGWLEYLPDISAPYKSSGKIGHRAWFTPEEYKRLYTYTAERAKNPPHNRGRWQTENADLHDYILFMTNTGLRPDEAKRLQVRDVTIVEGDKAGEDILEISVRGKRGTGWCMSMPGAVLPFQRMVERHALKAKDTVFPKIPRELFNKVLVELDLKFDREGNRRTAYSCRHTYFCRRLMDGADIYQLAKNGRTSVEMLEKFYVVHLRDMIDVEAINVRKPKKPAKKATKTSVKKARSSPEE